MMGEMMDDSVQFEVGMLPQWQPIETAPKDRTWVLVWETGVNEKYHPAEVARYVNNRWESSAMKYVNAIHWMPLPDPPKV